MTLDAAYPWLKACHVAAATTFVGGTLAVAVLLTAIATDTSVPAPVVRAVRRWDQAVTTPAMLLVWALGLVLATTGHWFTDTWLQLKLVFVLLLSGLHGVQSGRLRRLTGGVLPGSYPLAPAVIGCAIAIALLAVGKPF